MKDYDTTISELDYEQLPPALRRKYFSSLERLRLAQDGACPNHPPRPPREPQRPLTSSNTSSFSVRRSVRRPSTTLDDCLVTSSPSTRSRLRKHSGFAPITPQQVAQFAALPPVLQRKQFSREEQVLLASRINRVIFDAADEALYKQYGGKSRPSTSYKELSTDEPEIFGSEGEEMELSAEELESLKWLDEDEELDLALDDYHAAISETTTRKSHSSAYRAAFRRGLSTSNGPFSRSSSSTNSTSGHSAWPLPAGTSIHGPSKLNHSTHTSSAGEHRRNRMSTSSLDPAAAHYQDPAARMKLRVYLASPQKFDEAIEFGFPSMQESSTLRLAKPTTSTRSTESSIQPFIFDDTPSLSEGDDQEVDTFDSPRTPDMAAFSTTFLKSKESSLDRSSLRPKVMRDFTDPYIHALSANREMTLRMTLTRPDLRSPEETSSAREINAQPLEQAPLQFSDDVANFWDNLPDGDGKMRRLFRRLKLRS